MHNKRKLFQPLPDFIDRADPRVLSWRVDRIEETLESHQSSAASLLPFLCMAITWVLGILGLVSPAFVATVFKALLP